jgi:hypothetical protein
LNLYCDGDRSDVLDQLVWRGEPPSEPGVALVRRLTTEKEPIAMTVQLDHTIVQAHDRHESATFLAEVLGLPAPFPSSQFMVVEVDHGVSLDYWDVEQVTPQHYAFRVTEAEFERIFDRIRERALPYWADPRRTRPDEVGRRGGGRGRGFYFEDPSGHFLEVLTQPDQLQDVA